jgi:hypothetical protein
MDRYWLLTSTTYGTWLPGDPRGFVSRIREGQPPAAPRKEHDLPETPYAEDIPGLARAAKTALKCPPIRLVLTQAEALLTQFQETAVYRGWLLLAVAIMANHIHIVTGVPGDPNPDDILGDFKSYGSRALNRRWTRPASGTWWTGGAPNENCETNGQCGPRSNM